MVNFYKVSLATWHLNGLKAIVSKPTSKSKYCIDTGIEIGEWKNENDRAHFQITRIYQGVPSPRRYKSSYRWRSCTTPHTKLLHPLWVKNQFLKNHFQDNLPVNLFLEAAPHPNSNSQFLRKKVIFIPEQFFKSILFTFFTHRNPLSTGVFMRIK